MKILYFMHVDWHWIKQRPHFIVEGLAKLGHHIDVFYPFARNRRAMTNNIVQNENVSLYKYYRMPYKFRNIKFLSKLSAFLIREQQPRNDYDLIILTYPEQIKLIPHGFSGKIIYDCMDDHSEFEGVDRESILKDEQELCSHTNIVIASSDNLRVKMCERYREVENKIVVIRNGLSTKLNIEDICDSKPFNNKIAYLGTISEWIDFDSIIYLLENNKSIEIDLIGPTTIPVVYHERLHFLGPVDHDKLRSIMETYGTYIMPFKVNRLIESVDPVKLYEYIYFGGSIISCHYKEIERFSNYVNFYRDQHSLQELANRLDRVTAPSMESRAAFLKMNTWDARVISMDKVIREL